MALGDTARLIASLELQDKFSGTADKANKKLGGLEGNLQRGTRQMGIFGQATATALGIGLSRAVGAGVRTISGAITGGVAALNELESVTVATNTVIDSTKGIAGQTAQGIRDLSEEYETLNANMDDKVIQSGANMLLTFTNIREKAFEPALEAALNMNEAMGGGPEGLQSTIIQVGKALNDPIKGVTALRRVGVQLSEQQEDQIKTLVEQNDLYGAQQVILGELTTQFGGRFAAAGKTADGRMAAFSDRVEDLQKALAGPLIPAIDRVREKLIDLMGSPAALAAADKLGQALADLVSEDNISKMSGLLEGGLAKLSEIDLSGIGTSLSSGMELMGSLPWDAIGSAFELMGSGARAALDIFTSMPPWVQTAVLTGWGLNKLTGGALGNIVGSLGSGLIKGVLGMSAGVVNINAGVVNGGPGGLPGGGGGLLGGLGRGLLTGSVVGGAAVGVGAAAVTVANFQDMRTEAIGGLEGILNNMPRRTGAEIDKSIAAIEDQISQDRPFLEGILFNTNVKPVLERELAELQQVKAYSDRAAAGAWESSKHQISTKQAIDNLNSSEGTRFANLGSKQDGVASAVRNQHGVLSQIRDKQSNINVNNNITIPVSVNTQVVQNQIYRLRINTGSGGFI